MTTDIKRCVPCEGGVAPLDAATINTKLQTMEGWKVNDKGEIFRDFSFKNFYHTMSFTNALAHMANQQGHHPDLELGYNYCKVRYSTHAIGGISENDFICASLANEIFAW